MKRTHLMFWTGALAAATLVLNGCCSQCKTEPAAEVSAAAMAEEAPALGAIPEDSPARDLLLRAEDQIQAIVDVPDDQRTFDNTLGALDEMIAELDGNANMRLFMAYVSPDAEQRAMGQQVEQDFNNWVIDLSKREDLYGAINAYADTNPKLRGEEKRLLEHTMRDYRRAGMELPPAKRDKLAAIEKEISRLGLEFSANVRNDETVIPLTLDELEGMPQDYIDGLRRSGDIYLVGLSPPEFMPIQTFADRESTRQKTYIEYKRQGGTENIRLLEQMLKLRAEAAHLLGYPNAAAFEIEVRMAKKPEEVLGFYEKLRPLVREKARLDYQELVQAKREHTGDPDAKLEPWDSFYYTNKLLKDTYAVDSKLVQEYFPMQGVLDGLFGITETIYGVEFVEVTEQARASGRPFWHEDVRLFELRDTATGEMLGEIYLDLFPRPNKYSHAAQFGLRQHKLWPDGHVTTPLVALVCNFTKPTADKPSLLTHDEVLTLFHEFGHGLHTLLSEAEYYQFAGTNVELDFVETPSQMFENWCWDADVLATFARHYETGEPLPTDLLDNMVRARNLASGMLAERQFYYGMYDMLCHTDADGVVDTTQLGYDLWDPEKENVELYDPVPHTYFQAGFNHLTHYQAGYYGYQWALVYACDIAQRFMEEGMMNPELGMAYRKKVLARGGTLDGMDIVRDFLGGEPEMEPYLRHLGLETE